MVSADIFEWEWVNPADHSQGKQPSTTVVPGGAGLVPEPGLVASSKNLTQAFLANHNLSNASFSVATLTDADLSGANLTDAGFYAARLTNADLSSANLTDAYFFGATLTDADFTDAEVREANLQLTITRGFTPAQLYSTASYQVGDLFGIELGENDLTGWNFVGKNLTDASFHNATLTNVDFTSAEVRGTYLGSTTDSGFTSAQLYSTVSYQAGDLTGINLSRNDLTGWDFAGIEVRRASFSSTTFTAAQLYSTASYQAGDLTGIDLSAKHLIGWSFAGQNLTNAVFVSGDLTNTDFTDAIVRGTTFSNGLSGAGVAASKITPTQLYSTISYKEGDLRGIRIDASDLIGFNFSGKNLTGASFHASRLTNVDFTDANIQGGVFNKGFFGLGSGLTITQLYSTASYKSGNLSRISFVSNDLAGGNFSGQNLEGASFEKATLTNADLSGANLTDVYFRKANLDYANLSEANLVGVNFYFVSDDGFYETVSLEHANLSGANLTGVNFANADLRNADLSGADLMGASFTDAYLPYNADSPFARLDGANFSGSNLINTDFDSGSANWTNADYTGADARAAQDMGLLSALTHNFIHPDGHVAGLDITANEEMRLWDFNLATAIPIFVEEAMSIDSTGTLRAVFEDDAWGSTLTFDAGIGVSLDGTLELLVDSREGSNVASMVGVTFDLFDWTGVTPSGTFAQITIDAGLVWDLSDLYSTGEVTLLSAPSVLFADFDDNGVVDEADLDAWRAAFGSTTDLDADGNGNGVIDAGDYAVWRNNFVAPPSGDYNGDGTVDDADLLVWRAAFGSTTDLAADGNGDGVIDAADYTVWRDHYVAASVSVPEPTALLLTLLGVASCGWCGRRNAK